MVRMKELDDLIRSTHQQIWTDWHGTSPTYARAKLVITHNVNGAYYDEKKDEIHVDISNGNLTDSDILDPTQWPVWKVDLVEEMLHEYQHKVVSQQKSFLTRGDELWKEHAKYFAGKGHDSTFFSAVAKHANYFGLSPEDLIKALRGRMIPKYPNFPDE
jgi:hypothetical protein